MSKNPNPFLDSAGVGTADMVRFLLSQGIELPIEAPAGNTPVQQAAVTANLPVLRALFEAMPVEQRTAAVRQAIVPACNNVRPDALRLLLALGAEIPLQQPPNQNLLTRSMGPAVLAFLLEQGLDPNALGPSARKFQQDFRSPVSIPITPLLSACRENELAKVKLLLGHGANPNLTAPSTETPLLAACRAGNLAIVKLLVAHGARLDLEGLNAQTVLAAAMESSNRELIKFLLARGVPLKGQSQTGESLLSLAVAQVDQSLVQSLLDAGADINAVSYTGETALVTALKANLGEMVKFLIKHGADPNLAQPGRSWETSLFWAAQSGRRELVEILLAQGADSAVSEKNGWPVMRAAARSGNLELVKWLQQKGYSLKVQRSSGETPLFEAVQSMQPALIEYLLEAGQDPNIQVNGITPLMLIAGNITYAPSSLVSGPPTVQIGPETRLKLVQLLLAHGADATYSDERGTTALSLAVRRLDSPELIELLLAQLKKTPRYQSGLQQLLEATVRQGQADWLRRLLVTDTGLDTEFKLQAGPGLFHAAIDSGKLEILQTLAEAGFSLMGPQVAERSEATSTPIVKVSSNEQTLIYHTISKFIYDGTSGNQGLEILQFFLSKGLDPNLKSRNGETPLHMAVRGNRLDLIASLLAKGANVNALDDTGASPLIAASGEYRSNLAVFKLLLEHGADLSIATKQGDDVLTRVLTKSDASPELITLVVEQVRQTHRELLKRPGLLVKAAARHNATALDLLLKAGANVADRDEQGNTVLLAASADADPGSLQKLIDLGFDLHAVNREGNTVLHQAVRNNWRDNTDTVQFLLQKGFDLNAANAAGNTPLMLAVADGKSLSMLTGQNHRSEMIKFLLEQGARIDMRNLLGDTPLLMSVRMQDQPVIEALCAKGADVNASNAAGENALMLAMQNNSSNELITWLLKHGVKSEHRNREGQTALGIAISQRRALNVETLLSLGANPDVKDGQGHSPLFLAIASQQPEMIRILHKYHVDLEQVGPDGESALMTALSTQNSEIMQTLLALGCDPQARNSQGETVLIKAMENGLSQSILYLLLAQGVDIDAQAADGGTALIRAVQRYMPYNNPGRINAPPVSKEDLVRILLQHGANPSLKDARGMGALDYAFQNQDTSIKRMIQEALSSRSGISQL